MKSVWYHDAYDKIGIVVEHEQFYDAEEFGTYEQSYGKIWEKAWTLKTKEGYTSILTVHPEAFGWEYLGEFD